MNRIYLQILKNRENKARFFPPVQSFHKCLCCYGILSRFNALNFSSFENWKIEYLKRVDRLNKLDVKNKIAQINKLNSVRKGAKYIKNTKGYVIEVKNATKWFANKLSSQYVQVLHNINLRVKEGEFVVVLGRSGSGKSTLLNILSGIERPSNGHVVVAGHNLISLSEKELTLFRKDNLSFIFQNYVLIPDLTVRENIIQGAALQENVYKRMDLDELVNLIGIREHLNKYASQLSGGQKQRVAIVKSVIKNPKILFADEPTAAVDEATASNILKIFCDLNKRYNTTIVLITHNPIIAKIADRKIHIDQGRIVDCIKQKPVAVENLPWTSEDHNV